MEHSNSACFKDTHPPFTVLDNQAATFALAPPLSATSLFVRRTILHPDDPISPTLDPASFGAKNEYFEPQRNVSVGASSRSFTLTLRINAVYTISTRPSSKGQHTIPETTPIPARYCDSMTTHRGGRAAAVFHRPTGGVGGSAHRRGKCDGHQPSGAT